MTLRKPLVLNGGQVEQIQSGDTLDASANEVDVLAVLNGNAGSLVIGCPVYIVSTGTVDKAEANASATIQVLGLMKSVTTGTGASGDVQKNGTLSASTAQWDAITGDSGGLTAGAIYYLDPATAGMITTTAPSTVTQFVVRLGQAISATEFEINIQAPIKL